MSKQRKAFEICPGFERRCLAEPFGSLGMKISLERFMAECRRRRNGTGKHGLASGRASLRGGGGTRAKRARERLKARAPNGHANVASRTRRQMQSVEVMVLWVANVPSQKSEFGECITEAEEIKPANGKRNAGFGRRGVLGA